MKSSKKVEDYVRKHWNDMTNVDIANELGISRNTVIRISKRIKLPAKPKLNVIQEPIKAIEADKEKRNAVIEKNLQAQKYKFLLAENEELTKLLNIKNSIGKYHNFSIDLPSKSTKGKTESVAFALASDWHLEQEVRRDELVYDNQYNLEIAEHRAKEFFRNTLDLVQREQQTQTINTLVLWLGGDFITGNIHEEFNRICKLGPAQAVCFARDLLISGIEYLLKNSKLNIVCPYNYGNHSRITEKTWSAREKDNSLEEILYNDIAFYFKNNKRLTMIAPTGSTATMTVYGMKIGFVHGHHGFKYRGGVGGIYPTVIGGIKNKLQSLSYNLLVLGHFHQYVQDSRFICNGSMIGYDQYADSLQFLPEPPRQTFFLISSKWKCRTVTTPILFSK